MNIVAIIPARGGSKSVHKKNIALVGGKPMIAHTIEIAKASKHISRIIVSTDDEDLAKIARAYGAEVPFMQPKELAEDDSTMESCLKYVIDWLEENEGYKTDIMVFFQLTDFFKKVEWVDEAIEVLLNNPDIDSAFIGCKTHKNYWKFDNGEYVRTSPFTKYGPRQGKQPIFREDTGLGCATRAKFVKEGKRIGDRVKILEKDYEFFDVHSDFDLWLLNKVGEYLRTRSYD